MTFCYHETILNVSEYSGGSLLELGDGGVLVVGGAVDEPMSHGYIFKLSHAKSVWEELPQRLKEKRLTFPATFVPDSMTNCTIQNRKT